MCVGFLADLQSSLIQDMVKFLCIEIVTKKRC